MEEELIPTPIATDGVQLGILLQRLPSEVLHDVILKAQDSDPHIQLTLSHVNQFFRALVIASPLLWCKLDVLYPLSLVSLYLERSAEATLEVVVEQGLTPCRSPVLETREDVKAVAFYKILRPHCHRIRRLRVQGQASHSWGSENQNAVQSSPQLSDLPDHFHWSSMLSNLDYLDLGFRTWDLGDRPQWPVMSNLRELRLYGSWPPSVALLVPPSLKHLTLENQRRLTLEITKEILVSTPALESLSFSDVILVEPRGISEILDQPVQMTSLRSLSVTRCTGEDAKKLVQNIICANLEDLSIYFTGETERSYQSPVHGEYRRFHQTDLTSLTVFNTPYPQIRKLNLGACEAQPIFLEKVLDNLPGLRELKIASAALTNNHLKALIITPTFSGVISKPIRCPLLVSLHLDNEPAVGSNVVRHIARSRNEALIPLRSVTLRGFDLQKVFLEDLECIRESGVVDLTVTVFGEDEDHEVEKDPDWSSSWSTDEELEDELASGDEEILADSA
ncbi:hypothetical protein FRC04_001711 [Tulasnella sp. 424]|nr:hypothetical protein FRC04_001711 [Tulasnella sp. 424]KAG8975445.1 hypothetical protein FRC05_005775 [Tulasnella sp. 425]